MIKKLLVIITALIISIQSQAQNITWHTDFEKAVTKATAENKPLMLFFTGSDWCGWCKKIQKEVFVDKKFEEWAKKNVVLVEVDFPRRIEQSEQLRKQNASLQQQLGVQGYPTIYLVSSKNVNNKSNLSVLGSIYYQPGGAPAFIATANNIIKKK